MTRVRCMEVLITCSLLMHCTLTSELEIDFIEQPTGGKNITLLTCTFEGKLLEGADPIITTIQWWRSDSSDQNEENLHEEEHTFESVNAEQVYTEISAPIGDVFDGHYWVRIIWNDASGTSYNEESETAVCYEGPNNRKLLFTQKQLYKEVIWPIRIHKSKTIFPLS